jgi:hypothetical protein
MPPMRGEEERCKCEICHVVHFLFEALYICLYITYRIALALIPLLRHDSRNYHSSAAGRLQSGWGVIFRGLIEPDTNTTV